MIASVLGHAIERHAIDRGLNSSKGENVLTEVWIEVQNFFTTTSPVILVGVGVLILGCIIAWNLVGKGQGSHAGREEIRRAYRRELAKQMARQDAEKIKSGEKQRKRWMQW